MLARCIAEHFQEKDLILIDCAPTESVFTTAAYHASRFVLVPVRPEYFATIGFPLLQQSLDAFRNKNKGHQIDIVGIVINNSFYHGGNDGGPEKQAALRDIKKRRERTGGNCSATRFRILGVSQSKYEATIAIRAMRSCFRSSQLSSTSDWVSCRRIE